LSNPDLLKHLQGLSQQTNASSVEMPSALQAALPSMLLGDKDMRDPTLTAVSLILYSSRLTRNNLIPQNNKKNLKKNGTHVSVSFMFVLACLAQNRQVEILNELLLSSLSVRNRS
jgi:hypothetical protein